MKVKCVYNLAKDLPTDLIAERKYEVDEKFNLKINEIYTVYAVAISSQYVWYAICNEQSSDHAFWYPGPLFSIEDNRLSRYCRFKIAGTEYQYNLKAIIAFPESLIDSDYWSKLFDGEPKEVRNFIKYQELMALEFPDPEINDKASNLEDGWVMCPHCIDAWQPNTIDAMIICPKCQRVMHSPYYEKFRTNDLFNLNF